MTKNEFITKITEKVTLSKKDAGMFLDIISEIITEELIAGNEVSIPSVGKFTIASVPETTRKYTFGDKKGQTYTTPAHNAPKFKFSSTIKNAVK